MREFHSSHAWTLRWSFFFSSCTLYSLSWSESQFLRCCWSPSSALPKVSLLSFEIISFSSLITLVGSHFRFGTITWTKSSSNPKLITFTMNLALRRDYFVTGGVNVGQSFTDGTFVYGDGGTFTPSLYVNNIDAANDVAYFSWTGTRKSVSLLRL